MIFSTLLFAGLAALSKSEAVMGERVFTGRRMVDEVSDETKAEQYYGMKIFERHFYEDIAAGLERGEYPDHVDNFSPAEFYARLAEIRQEMVFHPNAFHRLAEAGGYTDGSEYRRMMTEHRVRLESDDPSLAALEAQCEHKSGDVKADVHTAAEAIPNNPENEESEDEKELAATEVHDFVPDVCESDISNYIDSFATCAEIMFESTCDMKADCDWDNGACSNFDDYTTDHNMPEAGYCEADVGVYPWSYVWFMGNGRCESACAGDGCIKGCAGMEFKLCTSDCRLYFDIGASVKLTAGRASYTVWSSPGYSVNTSRVKISQCRGGGCITITAKNGAGCSFDYWCLYGSLSYKGFSMTFMSDVCFYI